MPKFRTVRFGELEYNQEDLIQLPEGLVGMPNLKNWLILEMGDDIPMKWFQSLDRGDFGFPVTQPYLFHDDYSVKLPAAARLRLGNAKDEELATLIITTVHPGGTKVTGNLLAPLVIDTETRYGIQLTVDDSEFSMRQEINYFKFGLAVQSESTDNDEAASADSDASADSTESDTAQAGVGAESPEPAGV